MRTRRGRWNTPLCCQDFSKWLVISLRYFCAWTGCLRRFRFFLSLSLGTSFSLHFSALASSVKVSRVEPGSELRLRASASRPPLPADGPCPRSSASAGDQGHRPPHRLCVQKQLPVYMAHCLLYSLQIVNLGASVNFLKFYLTFCVTYVRGVGT